MFNVVRRIKKEEKLSLKLFNNKGIVSENNQKNPNVSRLSNINVFIIDDDESIAATFRGIYPNWAIRDARSAEDGLSQLVEMSDQPDIIFLDYKLPGMNGVECLRQCRNQLVNAKIVMMSGADRLDILAGAGKYGADAFLTKPFGLSELESIVQEAIDVTIQKT